MKVIFLDVDGVLNGDEKIIEMMYSMAKKLNLSDLLQRHHDMFGVRNSKIKLLSKIVKATDAQIVLSSPCHSEWDIPYEEKDNKQKQLADKLAKYGLTIMDTIGYSKDAQKETQRETEIREWLALHEGNIESFVILDDKQYDLRNFIGTELVRTSERYDIYEDEYSKTGLKRKHVKQAIQILNTRYYIS